MASQRGLPPFEKGGRGDFTSETIKFNHLGLIPRPAGAGLRLCHSREACPRRQQSGSGNPGTDIFSAHPPEFAPAEAEAGVTVVTLGQIPHSLLRGGSFSRQTTCQRCLRKTYVAPVPPS